MNTLNNTIIKNELNNRQIFDFKLNNNKQSIIVPLHNDPINVLKEFFNDILQEEIKQYNYYELYNLFKNIELIDSHIIIDSLFNIINIKVNTIKKYIDNNNINFAAYIQLWTIYDGFIHKIYGFMENYQTYLTTKKNIGKIHYDIINLLKADIFYDKILNNNNILVDFTNFLLGTEINKYNVEQLIEYICSFKSFLILRYFDNINIIHIYDNIKKILDKIKIINAICLYIHNLLQNLATSDKDIKNNGIPIEIVKKRLLNKIYKVVDILVSFCEKEKLFICYRKFLQIRILNLEYDNYKVEFNLVKKMKYAFKRYKTQILMNMIENIIKTKNMNKMIQNMKYEMEYDLNILNPIIIDKNIWEIYNNIEINPIYPKELQYYLNIITKFYDEHYKNQYILDWRPSLGTAEFETCLNMKNIRIKCNILQSIVLTYLNDHPKTTINEFVNCCSINKGLADKLFESLFEANLIINVKNTNEDVYVINFENYTGSTMIDIHKIFIELFDVEYEILNEISKQEIPLNKETSIVANLDHLEQKNEELDNTSVNDSESLNESGSSDEEISDETE